MSESKSPNKQTGHIPGRRRVRWLTILASAIALGITSVTAAVIGSYYFVRPSLPQAETIRDIPLQIPLRIFTRDGYLVAEMGERRRVLVTWEDLPDRVVKAFLAAEDYRFFEHPGVDYRGILRAFFSFVSTGDFAGGGGSTLTQQLARDYFLTREQAFTRKLREAFPQIDRVCWTTVDGKNLCVRECVQDPEFEGKVGGKGRKVPVAVCALAIYAKGDQMVVNSKLADEKALDLQYMSKFYRSSLHVPESTPAEAGTVNFWSAEEKAFPPEAAGILKELAKLMAEGAPSASK